MKQRRTKTVWCYLNGKKHCDALEWALAKNVMLTDAKKMLALQYPDMDVTFRVE